MIKHKWIALVFIVLLATGLGFTPGVGGGADQVDFPAIYIDASVGDGGVGSQADPYNNLSDVNWTTGGDNSIFDYLAGSPSESPTIYLKKGQTWRETMTVGASGLAAYPIVVTAYGEGADPIINGADVIETWTSAASFVTAWSSTPSLSWANASPGDYNLRAIIANATATQSGPKVRISIKGGPAAETLDGCSIGLRSGSGQDFASTPTRVTFSGNNYVAIGIGATVVSDEITYDFDDSVDHLAHLWWDDGVSGAYGNADGDGFYREVAAGGGLSDQTMVLDTSLPDDKAGWEPPITLIEVYQDNNVWQAACTTEPSQVYFDGTRGTKVASAALCNGANKWFWAANVLYVYYTEDPDGAVVIEAASRTTAITSNGKSYITISNLEVMYHNNLDSGGTIWLINGSDIIVDGITAHHNDTRRAIGIYGSGDDKQIINCTVYSNSHASSNASCGIGVGGTGNDYIVSGNTCYSNVGNGIKSGLSGTNFTNNLLISNNVCYQNGCDGIYVSGPCDGTVIEYNHCYENGQLVADIFNISLYQVNDNSIVRYNIVHDSNYIGTSAGGIRFDGGSAAMPHVTIGSGSQVYYNLIYNEYKGLVMYRTPEGFEVFNNVIYNSTLTGIQFSDENSVAGTIKNNIIHTAGTYLIWQSLATGAIDINYNCYYDSDYTNKFYWYDTAYSTFANWKTASSQDANSLEADPLMTDPASGDFTLLVTSPCIDAGVDVGLISDYLGNLVPALRVVSNVILTVIKSIVIDPVKSILFSSITTTGIDIGAYEYQY